MKMKTIALLLATSFAAIASQAQTVVFSDGTFSPSNWSVTDTGFILYQPGCSHISQIAAGGNP
jgi:hypothetical protein